MTDRERVEEILHRHISIDEPIVHSFPSIVDAMLEFRQEGLREELITKIFSIVENTPELNMVNYSEEQVRHQNESIVEIYTLIDEYLKTKE